MGQLLFELYSEEIPAALQQQARHDLERLFAEKMAQQGLNFSHMESYVGPRRLVLYSKDIAPFSQATKIEIKGPAISAPVAALDGFLKRAKLASIAEAEIRDLGKKGKFYFANKIAPPHFAGELLAQILPQIISEFPWPRAMRWGALGAGDQELLWIRPLRNILALWFADDKAADEPPYIIDFTVGGLKSNDKSFGQHSLALSSGPFCVASFADYQAQLAQGFVILDHWQRLLLIISQIKELLSRHKLALFYHEAIVSREVFDAYLSPDADMALTKTALQKFSFKDFGLLAEMAGLCENPQAILGSFAESFLQLPPAVRMLTIAKNQKGLIAENSPHFIVLANVNNFSDLPQIKRGNERVVNARLADAYHFWQEDQKISAIKTQELSPFSVKLIAKFALALHKPLDQHFIKLLEQDMVFMHSLGSQGERVERIAELALALWRVEQESAQNSPAAQGPGGAGAPNNTLTDRPSHVLNENLIIRAAALAKADLVSAMVREFPELQGYMGAHYAALQNEEPQVAQAIVNHYLPRKEGDELPPLPLDALISLSDKIDMLLGFWLIGKKPSSSRDPYGLRRAASAIGLILVKKFSPLLAQKLPAILASHISRYKIASDLAPTLQAKVIAEIYDFIALRLERAFIYEYNWDNHPLKLPYYADNSPFNLLSKMSVTSFAIKGEKLSYGNLTEAWQRAGLLYDFLNSKQAGPALAGLKRLGGLLASFAWPQNPPVPAPQDQPPVKRQEQYLKYRQENSELGALFQQIIEFEGNLANSSLALFAELIEQAQSLLDNIAIKDLASEQACAYLYLFYAILEHASKEGLYDMSSLAKMGAQA